MEALVRGGSCTAAGPISLSRSEWTLAVEDATVGVVGAEIGADDGTSYPDAARRGGLKDAGPVGGSLSGEGGRTGSCGIGSRRCWGALAIRFPPPAPLPLRSRGPDGICEVAVGLSRP